MLDDGMFEGLGIVLIEAQCCGLPCVASADVIPENARVTELLQFVSLRESPDQWAKAAINSHVSNRMIYAEQIKHSGFNIDCEAKHLEMILSN